MQSNRNADHPYSGSRAKASLRNFAIGKIANGLLGLTALLVVVRVLPPREFGLYVALLAIQEIVSLVSSFGLFNFAHRYVPELRVSVSGIVLARWLFGSIVARIALLSIAAILLWEFSAFLLQWTDIHVPREVFAIYVVVIVIEGTCRYLDTIFEAILLQGYAQVTTFVRGAIRLAGVLFLVYLSADASIDLFNLIKVEAIAFALGLGVALAMLVRYLTRIAPLRTSRSWTGGLPRVFRFLWPSYLAMIVGLAYGPDTSKILVTRVLGALETAAYGFAQSLAEMVRRYLPAQLLVGMVRPLIVAAHAERRDSTEVAWLSSLVLKINVFILAPLIGYFVIAGAQILDILSGGKYGDAGWLLVVMCCAILLHSLHLVLSIVAAAVEKADTILLATVFAVGGLIAMLFLIPRIGSAGAVIGTITGEVIWCAIVALGLRRAGIPVRIDARGNARILAIASVASVFGSACLPLASGIWGLGLSAVALWGAFLTITTIFRPFSDRERAVINRLLPRPIFIW